MPLMTEHCRMGGLHDFNRVSRKAEEAALRRYQAVHWLECFVGKCGISNQASEREFISCLRNGIILCNVINKIQPGSVPKVVVKNLPVQSESMVWDSQPLPAYQYFENVRNFLVAVKELNLPGFEASDLERENVEAGSAARVADCVLALKSYYEWKEWSGGKGVYKHVTAKSPLVSHTAPKSFTRPLGVAGSESCRRLDMPPVNDKQSLTDSIVEVLTEHMVDSKENISDSFVTSCQNGNQDPVQIFSELLSRCLQEKLRNKLPSFRSQDISREESGADTRPVMVLQENISLQKISEPCNARSRKTCSHYRQVLQSQERDLSDIKRLWSQTKIDFEDLQSQLFDDLKHLENLVEEMSMPALGYQKVAKENMKLYNMVQDLKGNIRVHCRIRPILNADAMNVIDFVGEDGSLVVGKKVFQFNHVYSPMAKQDELFKDAQPLIRSVMDGYNVCILAYGQTMSGKTHTMYGPSDATAEDMGIIFLALNYLFQIAGRRDIMKYEVYVQMVEICNEEIRDLLAEDSQFHGDPGIPDVTMHSVKSSVDAISLVKQGETNRLLSFPAAHSVVTVHVHGKDRSGNILRGRLQLVDLAGSDEVDKSGESTDKAEETESADKSLSCLKDVITSLSKKSAYIPYRNSKLTSLLQNGLGGHAKILMFVHVSPEGDNLMKSMSTLKFAQKVSTVELGAAHSNKINSEAMELKQEIEKLKSMLMEKEKSQPNRQLRSPCEKAKVIGERSPLKSRRLSMESSGDMKTDKVPKSPMERQKITTESTPHKSLRKSIENASSRKPEKTREVGSGQPKEPRSPCEKPMLEGSVPRPRRLSIENPMIVRSEKAQKLKEPKSPYDGKKGLTKRTPPNSLKYSVDSRKGNKTSPFKGNPGTGRPSVPLRRLNLEDAQNCTDDCNSADVNVSSNEYTGMVEVPRSPLTAHASQLTFTDCAVKFSTVQPPRTPEQSKLYQPELLSTLRAGTNISMNTQTPSTAKSTNGKGLQIKKSLRTIGKLINGSEKKNQQKLESLSIKGKGKAKSPTSEARALRRQSLTGIPPPGSDRRSSLGGMSNHACPPDNRNAKTPPPICSSTKTMKRWM